jgi:hypothetical protein
VTAFLGELGQKLADRWIALVLAPGLLLVVAIALAARLGQAHALDVARLYAWITATGADPASHSAGALLLAAAGVLAACAAAGLAAGAAGSLIERAWTLPGRRRPARALVAWRRRRWTAADAQARGAFQSAARAAALGSDPTVGASPAAAPRAQPAARSGDLAAALARRDAICLVEPERPTWVGDRLRATDLRVHRAYDLDLGTAWPRLWSLAPDPLRSDLSAAQDAYTGAARLTGWGLLYAGVAFWWWPAAPIAVVCITAAWVKARAAADVLADLVETTVDLHARDLAAQLGIPCDGPLTRATGYAITARLRKDETSTQADLR